MALGELVVSIIGDMKELSKTFSQAKTDFGSMGKDIEGVGKSLSSTGSSMTTGVTAPIIATGLAIGGVASEAMGFQKGMTQVYTLLPNASAASMGAMGEHVKQFSKDMHVTTDEVVPALYDAIGSGVPEENVFSFLEIAQKGATAAVTDIGTSVEGLTSITNAYGIENLSAAKASDVLFTGINVGKMSYEELSASLYNVVPTAASLKVSFGDVTAALAAMTAQGTPTTVATTQLRQLLVELSKEGTAASGTFKEISGKSFPQFIAEGGTLQQAITMLGDGFTKTSPQAKELQDKIAELSDPTSGLAQEFQALTGKSFKDFQREGGSAQDALKSMGLNFDDANARLSDCFGSIEAGNAVLGLTGQGAGIFDNALKEMANSAGATDEAYAKMSKTTAASLDGIKADLQVAAVTMGESFLPVIQDTIVPLITDTFIPALEAVIPIIGSVAGAFNDLPQPVKIIILAIIAFIAALGPVLMVVGSVIETIGVLAGAFGAGGIFASAIAVAQGAIAAIVAALGTIGAPILIIIGVVALLAAAWTQNWFGIRDKAASVWDWLKTQAGLLHTGLKNAYDAIISAGGDLKTQFGAAWDALKSGFSTIGGVLAGIAQGIYTKLQGVYNQIVAGVNSLKASWSAAWAAVHAATSSLSSGLHNILTALYAKLQGVYNQIVAGVTSLKASWSAAWAAVHAATNALSSGLHNVLTALYARAQAIFGQIKAAASTFHSGLNSVWSSIKAAASAFASALQSAISSLYSKLQSLFGQIKSAASSFHSGLNSVWSSIKSAASSFASALQSAISSLYSRLQSIFGQIKSAASSLHSALQGIWNSIVSAAKSAGSNLYNAISGIPGQIRGLVGAFSSAGSALLDGLYESLTSGFSKVKGMVSDKLNSLKKLLPNSPAKEGPFRVLPNWDAIFVDPIKDTIAKTAELAGPLSDTLSSLHSPVDSLGNGFGKIASVSNSTNIGGDTISIGPNTISDKLDMGAIFEIVNQKTAEKRRARGLYK